MGIAVDDNENVYFASADAGEVYKVMDMKTVDEFSEE